MQTCAPAQADLSVSIANDIYLSPTNYSFKQYSPIHFVGADTDFAVNLEQYYLSDGCERAFKRIRCKNYRSLRAVESSLMSRERN